MLDKIQKDFDKKTQEEKIEILDKMIEKNTKKTILRFHKVSFFKFVAYFTSHLSHILQYSLHGQKYVLSCSKYP